MRYGDPTDIWKNHQYGCPFRSRYSICSLYLLLAGNRRASVKNRTFPGYKQMYLVGFHDCLNRCVVGTRVPSSAMFKTALLSTHTNHSPEFRTLPFVPQFVLFQPWHQFRLLHLNAFISTFNLHLLTIFKLPSLLFESQVLTGARPHREWPQRGLHPQRTEGQVWI